MGCYETWVWHTYDIYSPCRLGFKDHWVGEFLTYPIVWYLVVLILYFNPDEPRFTLLGTESEDNVSFMLCSYALCQERYIGFGDDTCNVKMSRPTSSSS